MSAPHVSLATKLSYGIGGFGKDFNLIIVNTFLFFYYTDIAGASAYFVGLVFLGARIWDSINDPIFGYLVAKTKSRWGKYKPWILVGNILNAIALVMLFSAHLLDGTAQYVYIAVTYVIWGMCYTFCDAPFWSLIPTITLDKTERERLLPFPRIAATLGSYLASGCGIYAVNLFASGEDKGPGYIALGTIAGVLALASAIVTCIWTKQTYEDADEKKENEISLSKALKLVFKNDQFLIFLGIAISYCFATNLVNGLNLYFFKYVIGDTELFSFMMLWAGIFGVGSLFFFKQMISALSRRRLFLISMILPFIASVLLLGAANSAELQMFLIAVAGILTGLSNAVYWLIVMIMVADTVDYGDVKFGIRSESISYSLHTLVNKCSGAICSLIMGLLLTAVGYVPNVEQTEQTIQGISVTYVGISVFCLVAAVIYMRWYKLNGKGLDQIQANLEKKYEGNIVNK